MRLTALSLIAAAILGMGAAATLKKPVPIDPRNPCDPLPTQLVCIKGHCFLKVLPCNPHV